MVKGLVDSGNMQGLQNISQRFQSNAFHGLRIAHPQGIHGICPMEMLHQILLGIFSYTITCFKDQVGASSTLADEINGLAMEYARQFKRQSDRDLPRCTFAKGIFQGKIMGKEYCGLLLLLLVVLHSDKGHQLLQTNRNFKQRGLLLDWQMLLETLLQWECFLKLPEMKRRHVSKLKNKHRYLMFLIKKVLNQNKGMGLKIMKFHGILHIADDILWFGVPSAVDTSPNESHHKPTKACALRTQRDISVFESQTCQRLEELRFLDLAMREMQEEDIFGYFDAYEEEMDSEGEENGDESEQNVALKCESTTTGTAMGVKINDQGRALMFTVTGKTNVRMDAQVRKYLGDLQQHIQRQERFDEYKLLIWTEHKQNGHIFRGHPNYRGKGPWLDWVKVDWGNFWGKTPAQIWCFVDLSSLPGDFDTHFHECDLSNTVYAVVETASYCENTMEIPGIAGTVERNCSDMLVPLIKEGKSLDDDGRIQERQLFLADVDAILEPLCVVPNIGRFKRRYFEIKARKTWNSIFEKWLDTDFNDEEAEINEEETRSEPAKAPVVPTTGENNKRRRG